MNETVLTLSHEKCFWYMYLAINKSFSVVGEKNLHMCLTAITIYKYYFDDDIKKLDRKSKGYQQIANLIENFSNRINDNDIYLFQIVLEYIESRNCYENIEVKNYEIVVSEVIKLMSEEKYIKEVLL